MNRFVRSILLAAGVWMFLAGTGSAGWEIHERTTSPTGGDTKQVTYLEKNRVRVEMPDSVQVMDFRSRKILMIDKREKTYSVMTFDEFKRMVRENMKAASKAIEEMKRRGISIPGAASQPKRRIEVRKLPGATIAGYPCDGYQVRKDGEVTEEIWTTTKIDLSREFDPANYREFADLSRETANMIPGGEETKPDPALQKVYESGYVMKTVYKETGDVDQVTRAERKTLPASLFTEPKGYKKVPSAMRSISRKDRAEEPGAMSPARPGRQEFERSHGDGVVPGGQSGEVAGTPSEGAKNPDGEKEGGGLDSLREGAKKGIRKLFKW